MIARGKEGSGPSFVTPILATQGELAHLHYTGLCHLITHKAVNVRDVQAEFFWGESKSVFSLDSAVCLISRPTIFENFP